MDSFSKKLIAELREIEQTGRIMRNMSIARMMPYTTGSWQPPVDIYEAETDYFVYVDLAGVDRDSLKVIAEERRVHIKGVRQLPPQPSIACVHQLEIELGVFGRTVVLPGVIDVDAVSSAYKNGLLVITLPKHRLSGNVQIRIIPGE